MTSIYPSKVDWWLLAILVAIPLFVVALGTYFAFAIAWWLGLLVILFGLFVAGIMACLTIPCRYSLSDSYLLVECGWSKDLIELKKIREILPSRNPLSAPALSLSRLKIVFDDGFLLISPLNRDCFLEELKMRRDRAG